MQVKVFEAKDMATGLKMVKEALGPDALILSTRTIRSGKFGMLGKPMMEITAAVDNGWQEPEPAPSPRQERVPRSWSPPPQERFVTRQPEIREEITYEELWRNRAAERDPEPMPQRLSERVQERYAPPEAMPRREPGADNQDLQREMAELRSMVKGLSNRLSGLDAPPQRTAYVEPEFVAPPPVAGVDPVVALLTGYGINQETAQVVVRFSRDTIERMPSLSHGDLHQILRESIARLFTTQNLLAEKSGRQRRISLIGPTGVGKTTTLAKIAAHCLSRFEGRIGLITIDTYRIAAVEQLKVYGEIMRLPLEVVIKPSELDQALDKFRDLDLILIDTAGRSPRSGVEIQELASFLRPQLGIENNLLLSATSRERELEETIRRFSILPISNFIFSKIDECDQLGVLLNIHYKNDTPISFLTNGQRVPEDLLIPTPKDIAALLMNDHGYPTHG